LILQSLHPVYDVVIMSERKKSVDLRAKTASSSSSAAAAATTAVCAAVYLGRHRMQLPFERAPGVSPDDGRQCIM
jgi:hypothetical protein